MVITCPVNDTIGVCDTLNSAGAGIGVFLQYLVIVLPVFLIIIGLIGGVIAIVMAIAHVIEGSVKNVHRR